MLDFMKASDMSIASSTSLMSYTSSPVVEVSWPATALTALDRRVISGPFFLPCSVAATNASTPCKPSTRVAVLRP